MAWGAKKKDIGKESSSVTALLDQPPQGEMPMSKPETYFSIKNEDPKDESPENKVLFYQDDPLLITYKMGRYNAERSRLVKKAHLLKFIDAFEMGATENDMNAFCKFNGYAELQSLFKIQKINILDFCQWLEEEVKKAWPSVAKAGAGTRTTSDAVTLASIINKLADMTKEGEKPNLAARANELVRLVSDPENLKKAVEHLETKMNEEGYGWNQKKTMEISDKKTGGKKEVANPAYGQIILKKS